jgi:glyoxylase-like metal-dependent hydrolase (beta-lactamase superfamily II)
VEPTRQVTQDINILPSYFPVPGMGVLPVNAFVIKGREPVLVDTGLPMDREAFMRELEAVIDPADIRWLWLTHPDPDHIGSLQDILNRAPNMKMITTFVGLGFLSLTTQVPLDRVYFLNPGESLDIGDRTLTAVKPPTFDNPATTGFYDTRSRVLFSSDCFGGMLQAPAENAGDIPAEALHEGQVLWTTVDSAWLYKVDEAKFAAELNAIRQMEPEVVLSSHLPPAGRMTDTLLQALVDASKAPRFVGPDQAALEAMMAQMASAAPGTR